MNEAVILKKLISVDTPKQHNVRRAALASCVGSLLSGATGIGCGISSYRLRIQIEDEFKDIKSSLFGLV